MIKKITCWIALVFLVFPTFSQQHNWQPKKDKILSEWAINIDPNAPLPEYPRPQMSRENWTNLNGIWKYAIIEKGSTEPDNFQGDILVPYAIESALSGVGQTVSKDQELWYHRSFEVDRGMRKGNLLLHFGAVDWEAEVFINGKSVGMH